MDKINLLEQQNCLVFEYLLNNEIQGKTDEEDGIFFTNL